jgi:PAS domain-containing protein
MTDREHRAAGADEAITAVLERAEEALHTSEQRFRLIVDNARDYAIFTSDPDDRIDGWYAGAAAVFGWTAEEIAGQPGAILVTAQDRAEGAREWEAETAKQAQRAANAVACRGHTAAGLPLSRHRRADLGEPAMGPAYGADA